MILDEVLALVNLGIDVAPYLKKLADTFKAGGPPVTDAQIDACRTLESQLSAGIQAPLPPERS